VGGEEVRNKQMKLRKYAVGRIRVRRQRLLNCALKIPETSDFLDVVM